MPPKPRLRDGRSGGLADVRSPRRFHPCRTSYHHPRPAYSRTAIPPQGAFRVFVKIPTGSTITVDAEGKPLAVSVRVGQAVDTVGQAGKPKTITGFQTHTTPVLLGARDRAELAAGEYLPALSTLEGTVILRKNPDWNPTD